MRSFARDAIHSRNAQLGIRNYELGIWEFARRPISIPNSFIPQGNAQRERRQPNQIPDTGRDDPVGGNTGTTLGGQRLIAFQHAADIWGQTLDRALPIVVDVAFVSQTCTAAGAVLGSAGTTVIFRDFPQVGLAPGPVAPNLWHSSALSDKRAGGELNPTAGAADIRARFNINLNGNPACLGGRQFYLGLDANHGNDIDLVATLQRAHLLAVFSGADANGFALLYTPNPVEGGSTISHWDTSTFPNQLMEPAISGDLTHSVKPPQDLTLPLLRDIGWFPDADVDGLSDTLDACDSSNFEGTVSIDGEDTGVVNVLFTSGRTISDLVASIAASAGNHGNFVSGVAHLSDALRDAGIITSQQRSEIQRAAAHADTP